MTSRPPTAVTTDLRLTPAASNSPRIASETRPGSMTSPSTIASAATSVVATLVSSASLPPWSITTSLMIPDPISSPTEVFLPPNNPKRAICTFLRRDKKGRGQTTIGPAPYPVKPRIDLRPKQQLSPLLLLTPLLVELNPPALLNHRDAKELVRAVNVQRPVDQQDTLALVAVERDVTGDVDDREVVAARTGRI